MRCERCKFENIPGQTTCVKCGSALQLKSEKIDIYPPRMPKWEKSFRKVSRSARKNKALLYFNTKVHTPQWLTDLFNDRSVGLFLCLIPGLAHVLSRRFKEIWLYFTAWLVLLLVGLFFYGSFTGSLCIGLAIGFHVGIIIKYGLFKDLDSFREKTVLLLLTLLGLLFLYGLAPNFLFPFLRLSRSAMSIPSYNISEGDTLLARTHFDRNSVLARGSLVLVYPSYIDGHRNRTQFSTELIVAEIVGLPGEHIQVTDDAFIINRKPLDVGQYPVPIWLQRSNFSCIIPEDSYFVSAQYNLHIHGGVTLTDINIRQVCIVAKNVIEARVFMRWLPLSKRGFLQ
ncbi:MAG: hypothetical protein JW787_11490 [Sedimentisphaerales bacterium]|nr:hypothetical protein [Sedimentisphaerales bacterium]